MIIWLASYPKSGNTWLRAFISSYLYLDSKSFNIENLSLVTIFILPPDKQVLRNRLLNRHDGQEKIINERMKKFSEEMSHWNEYNYVVINDDLEKCYDKILKIIISEKKGKPQKQNLQEIKKKVEELIK